MDGGEEGQEGGVDEEIGINGGGCPEDVFPAGKGVLRHLLRRVAGQDLQRRWKIVSSSLIAVPQQMYLILTNVLCSKLPVIQVGTIL